MKFYSPYVRNEHAEPPLIVALDVGTSSVRGVLFDRIGRAVRGVQARRNLEQRRTPDGGAEIDPDALVERILECLDEVVGKSGTKAHLIGGVAACTFVSNIMGVDQSRRALTPLFLYSDTRSQQEAERLREELDEESIHDRTGCPIHSSYLPARFRWLAKTQAGLFRRVFKWISIGEYLELKLFGRTSVTYSVASWTGLLNRRTLFWDDLILEELPVNKEGLSPLTDVQPPRRGLHPPFSRRWPTLKEVPWFPAVADGAAANVGSGCVSPSRVAVTIGTSSAVRSMTPHPPESIPPGLWCYRVTRTHSLPGGALSEGGNVFLWAGSLFGFSHKDGGHEALTKLPPDGHGLTVLPFFSGERSPGWAGNAKATIHGLTLATTSQDMLQASVEAVTYRIAMVYRLLRPLLPNDPEVVGSGGALNDSRAWRQLLADVLGVPVTMSLVREASARGAALMALQALGEIRDLSESPEFLGPVYLPDPQRHRVYRAGMKRQGELYEKLVLGGSFRS